MTASDHLSLDQVRAYVRGALHPSTLVSTDDHLEVCASCRAALARESDASFGAEAFGRALATPDARPESPHLTFEDLRGAVDGGLSVLDREWLEAHVALCVMCAEELRDLERFAATLPGRPAPPRPVPAAPASPAAAAAGGEGSAPRPRPRLQPVEDAGDPPARYGQAPPTRLPLWIKVAVAASLAAILQLWAC
jgi:anti-sigma factor RsiW